MTPPWRTYPSPHIRPYHGVQVIDYNGTGRWSSEGIQARYVALAKGLQQQTVAQLQTRTSTDGVHTRVWPVMDQVVELVELHDGAAIELALDMLEEDEFFAFGSLIKSNIARALRRAPLSESQQVRARKRIVTMLLMGNVPHEFKQYKRLLRRVGVGNFWPMLDAQVKRGNPYIMRHYRYLDQYARAQQ